MNIIEQSIELVEDIDSEKLLWKIEAAARNCYKSEGINEEKSRAKRDALIQSAVRRGHTSVLEHGNVSFRVICNRGVSHEWVRHRIGWSYSQESTRYCNYGHSGITFIWPWFLGPIPEDPNSLGTISWKGEPGVAARSTESFIWYRAMESAEKSYLQLLKVGCKPEAARGVLPNDLKTEIVCTANIVALRHFFKLRCAKAAHPQIRALAAMLLERLMWAGLDILFQDLIDEHLMGKKTEDK